MKKNLFYYIKKLIRIYYFILYYVMIILVPFLIITVTYQVVARYIDFIPRFLWTEEISRFTLIWLVMIGAALGIYNRDHFDIDMFSNLSPRLKRLRTIFIDFSTILFTYFLIRYGWVFAKSGLRRISLAARIPMAWIYASFLFLGISAIVFQLKHILEYFEKAKS